MNLPITLLFQDNRTKEVIAVSVQADVVKCLAVHPTVRLVGTGNEVVQSQKHWSVTHTASGWAVLRGCTSRRMAQQIRKRLLALGVNWDQSAQSILDLDKETKRAIRDIIVEFLPDYRDKEFAAMTENSA